jgi:hypothetical protein
MTRLAFDRAAVQGDEMVIVRDHSVIAYPRRFGLRRGTLDLIPEASRLAPGRVREPSPHDYQVVSFDPAEQGLDWRIREAPVDDIVLLVRHDNPMSSISPCDRHEMARHVMANSHGPTGDPRQWIRDACAILAGARCSILTMGDLGSGVAMLREAVRAPAHTG